MRASEPLGDRLRELWRFLRWPISRRSGPPPGGWPAAFAFALFVVLLVAQFAAAALYWYHPDDTAQTVAVLAAVALFGTATSFAIVVLFALAALWLLYCTGWVLEALVRAVARGLQRRRFDETWLVGAAVAFVLSFVLDMMVS
jgi:hypothetical protein